jgi:hypothetical protein
VRPAGLAVDVAAARLHALLSAAPQAGCRCVAHDDESDDAAPQAGLAVAPLLLPP